MKPGWIVPPLTDQRQALAANPRLSAWVSANAGSGKTHVLVNRVLRLLLDDVAPGRLLCITYTKAAAANMANRVFAALSAWATLPEDALVATLAKLTGEAPSLAQRKAARRLFAQALETPGGLRIETIHAFCTRVLQSAPFEANVPPRFEVADDLAQAEMLRAARRELLMAIAADPQGAEAGALDLLARQAAQDTFEAIIQEALRQRALFSDTEGRARDQGEMRDGIATVLGIAPDLAAETVREGFREDLAGMADLAILVEALDAGSPTRQSFAATLRALIARADDGDPVAFCRRGFLTEAGTVNSNISGRGKSAFEGALLAAVETLAARLCHAIDQLNAIAIRDRSHALALLVTRMLASYQRQKSERSLLDYDDLIARTRSLLTRVEAAWVLYKLDAGIDHILLDEAQDTSDAQWAILRQLAEEFSAGGRDQGGTPRTVFVVGDEKQSIYGFQGAAPAAFNTQRRQLGQRITEAEQRFEPISLNTSFRSAPDIMQAVDAVFAVPEHARGLVFDGSERPETHDTVRQGATGCVDLWPLCANDTGEPPDAWTTPVDAPERRSGTAKLAQRIATTLATWMRRGVDDLGQPFSPGDVMILLRQRGALFETIVKALKDAGVPVTGRDRLTLADHPAVEDLLVLGRTLLLPEDDLTLATALKTPLVGLDDDDLLRLAPGRSGSLRAALREAAASEPRFAAVEAQLTELAAEAGRCGPFRFFAGLLGPGGGRNLALARLGAEAGDALDAFLSAALEHERRYGPSLSGFLRHVGEAATDVKRDLSSSRGEVRVMTVHGAKGLEAGIVILADLAPEPGAKRLPKILAVEPPRRQAVPIWPPASAEDARATTAAKARVIDQMVEEHHRLLYVAMTRAEDRLIICGAQAKGEAPAGSWYAMVEAGLAASAPGLVDIDDGATRRFMTSRPQPHPVGKPTTAATPEPAPAWLRIPPPREHEPAPPLKPSSALAAADGPNRPAEGPFLAEAAAAGRFAHLLLQLLPDVVPDRRVAVAHALGLARAALLAPARRDVIIADALALLAEPGLAALFGPGSLAEVPVAGLVQLRPGEKRSVSGQVDRLAVSPDEVIIADFKTTARPPRDESAIAETTLAQLAVYRALIGQIYPGRRVRALLVYTATLTRLEPDPARLDAVLAGLGLAAPSPAAETGAALMGTP
ncbi:double-strand break repair helicase AddA [Bosea sp. (in: a-proteobacteria)]|uniref:double-strand break repair helicase AddA n=1 Tax=Bosea sp. (in: a-proteobacteria) TaxID=1871050 RepID=UPI0027326758|nr:double-strand break repair helicase AddA [Bosea sp. (in: a-proteobacteria)]MDP3407528.1 double-strand break repair helicase AddA [Bosea sp. (in: a-proteobacteria)]